MPLNIADNKKFMQLALQNAEKAYKSGEVPVGAVLVGPNQDILGQGYNQVIGTSDSTAHAEIVALREANLSIQNYRLPSGCTMFVTLEPCIMCLGALIHARLEHLVIGSRDPKTGACGGRLSIHASDLNHHMHTTVGVLSEECSKILKDFFREKRIDKDVGNE
ncbi:putative zinc-binding cytidine/deoxycytidylate deaminase [Taylorella equigenitalis 14/56]|uniref:tRNA-specific adenosine deaminase n=4 Tax=Taylorella equigenitalis TaxID=29575 RepID=A0A654KJ48_TAYEM|nr:tRNA adenosine(34) deaminase TadA [Taylorella equigenitalis]ADU92473.1 tRNA-specific adenosine-34 deaminase [Taylorella equigenitalis MCE9]AFN36023.1 putative zinc-binding cytidine/deoxycytidylate deaminase [Taylorella equigenitalis ATCC 35865]ASY30655.1 tRNA-specific adenosine deaminase [Taylorella equigenitalis]ASY37962.1 nucleoside deaminase [Taylorella equigenitalis]ASY39436.1 tRNA-specific adenosine deaminase [Taylorella equigenitalis]